MKWVLIILAVLAGLAVLILVAGALKPASHQATVTVSLAAPPDSVWQVISDIEKVPDWFDQVTKVERLPDNAGRPSYREFYGGFEATTVVTESAAPSRLVKEILPTGPFFGTWTWELAPVGTGTRLTVTERGTVGNAFLRGLMFFADNEKTMRLHVAALEKRLART